MNKFTSSPEFEEKVRKAMSTPDASPEFVNRLLNEVTRRPTIVRPRFVLRPAWAIAIVLVLIVIIVSAPKAVNALKRLLGYLPEVGMVENTGNLRMLAEPVSMRREGVTLTITSVLVFPDRVELIYAVKGIATENDGWQTDMAKESPKSFCGGVEVGEPLSKEGNALLRLPDGTLLERDYTGKYPQNAFAWKPVYEAKVPADVLEMTLVLDCLPMARHGAVPEHWEVPFKLVEVPEGTVVGEPLVEVEVTSVPPTSTLEPESTAVVSPSLQVSMKLERFARIESGVSVSLSMNSENPDPSLISIMPLDVYVIDSLGQKTRMVGTYAWQAFQHPVGSSFEFMSQTKPAQGPLTLVVENAVVYYAPLYTDPPQATPDQMSFTFDVGQNPQYGQTWDLNHEFEIAGYKLKVTSARATNFTDIQVPGVDYSYGSQGYEYGYDFAVQADPSVKMQVEMDIISESPMCWLTNVVSVVPESPSIHYTQLCRDEYPKGQVRVTLWELSVLVENIWQATWTP